ncbi:DUF58 domain-containing protein [Cnuibacter physcomitrellae]|uniref:DUF58 domain-containing protein n=1 Tax=Cnuibacter physcomitrellae TaxID=1619308 RepID=UPI0021758E9C|nr:DUF58 domain-containing protein [Cnuibacter physcomitrellae]MCS5498749.1 DUF58 domain-containing protein [Cnuibacter physcomitrellae]
MRTLPVAVSAGGWTVLGGGIAALVAGLALGWAELVVIGVACLVTALVCALLLLGRRAGRMEISVAERHVVAGARATVSVSVQNSTPRRLRATEAELPVGDRIESLDLPGVRPGGQVSATVVVQTPRRGVLRLGPVRVVRRDPLGLARREVSRSDARDLYVHPRTVDLAVASTGLLRDLEGLSSRDLTDSDMAFHTLREYVPGDDRRHIHWRSTAKTGSFMVRQFEQTRRSHLVVALSTRPGDYAGDEEFELAVSIAASIGVRAVRDATTVSVLASGGSERTTSLSVRTPRDLLDDLSVVHPVPGTPGPARLARSIAESGSGASVVLLVCGSAVATRELRSAAAALPPEVEVIGLVADPEASASIVPFDGIRVARIGYLDDLVRALVRMAAT